MGNPGNTRADTPAAPVGGRRLVVIGSGLAGLTAALEAARAAPGLEVLILEKNHNVGGNSARASSGINAVNPAAGDSVGLYTADTLRSGGGLSDERLVDRLAASSADALAFLESLGLDLSSIVQLGGHSAPRTRSNPTGPNVGFALIRATEAAVRRQKNVCIITGATVTSVAYSSDGRLAVGYTQHALQPQANDEASVTLLADGLVFAGGGFAASKEMLSRYAPEAAGLPTTNGPWATGDGTALAAPLRAALVQMDQVQVHPTGFIDPKDPNSGSKFLAPEKLRGCGAVLLGADGRRFVDELTTRDVVAAAIKQQPGARAWLLLGPEGGRRFGEGTLAFYASKGLVTKLEGVEAAATNMGVRAVDLRQELEQYDAEVAAAAAAGGATVDSAVESGHKRFGKHVFPSRVLGSGADGPLWLALVTPVVHYCMGGLQIGPDAEVLDADGAPLRGVWAAGEAAGGLHGKNRLGGNSLAECVVFGRIAGKSAASHVSLAAGKVQHAPAVPMTQAITSQM